jgi:regulation of enolase protein 1 (concanavalin A-like superfamily)
VDGTLATAVFDNLRVDQALLTSSMDLGSVGLAGSTTFDGIVHEVKASGADIWGTADAFRYAYTQLSGDGAVVARVVTVQNVNVWTKAGVMIRQALDPASPHASMFVTPGKGLAFQRRKTAAATSVSTSAAGVAPQWVKLARAGQVVTASISSDGVSWTAVGQDTIALSGAVWIGLAVTSHDTTQAATATFDGVAIAQPAALPEGWANADIGATAVKGSASFANSTFSVSGSGADIWGTGDAFQFVYKTLNGDGELVARVASVENPYRWAKAGVMVRANLSANAPNALMLVSAAAGTAFQSRVSAGGTSTSVSGGAAIAAPYWVKIVRAGTVLTGYQSADGASWTRVGSVTIAMGPSVQLGVAVTSHDNTRLSKAVLEQIVP